MMLKAVLPLVVGLCALVRDVSSECDGSPRINGCSIPLGFYFFYKDTFREACNRHDVCYGCGIAENISRSECDEAFLRDMISTCVSNGKSVYQCVGFAVLYYQAVRKAGEARFLPSVLDYCQDDWVADCLPPTAAPSTTEKPTTTTAATAPSP